MTIILIIKTDQKYVKNKYFNFIINDMREKWRATG